MSKVTEESNLAPYIRKGWTKTVTLKTKQHKLLNRQKTTQKHERNNYGGKRY